jgi:hypothetical protein
VRQEAQLRIPGPAGTTTGNSAKKRTNIRLERASEHPAVNGSPTFHGIEQYYGGSPPSNGVSREINELAALRLLISYRRLSFIRLSR